MIKQMIISAFMKDFITKIYFHFSWLYEMLWGKTQTDYGRELLIHVCFEVMLFGMVEITD